MDESTPPYRYLISYHAVVGDYTNSEEFDNKILTREYPIYDETDVASVQESIREERSCGPVRIIGINELPRTAPAWPRRGQRASQAADPAPPNPENSISARVSAGARWFDLRYPGWWRSNLLHPVDVNNMMAWRIDVVTDKVASVMLRQRLGLHPTADSPLDRAVESDQLDAAWAALIAERRLNALLDGGNGNQ